MGSDNKFDQKVAVEKIDAFLASIVLLDPDLGGIDTFELYKTALEIKETAFKSPDPKAVALSETIAVLFEKILMDEIKVAQDTIELITKGFVALKDIIEAVADPEKLDADLKTIYEALGFLGAKTPAAKPADAPKVAQAKPAKSAPAAKAEPADTPKKKEPEKKEAKKPAEPVEPPKPAPPALTSDGTLVTEAVHVPLTDINDAEIYIDFSAEVKDNLDELEVAVLALEENREDPELINKIFRIFHSMKGAAGFLALHMINKLAHRVEDLLNKVRKNELKITSHIIDIILQSLDMVKTETIRLQEVVESAKSKFPNAAIDMPGVDLTAVFRLITAVESGEVEEDDTPLPASAYDQSEELSDRLGDILVETAAVTPEQLEKVTQIKEKPIGELLVQMGVASPQKVEKALQVQEERRAAKEVVTASIKIDANKIDQMLEMIGELVIQADIMNQLFKDKAEADENISRSVASLMKITRQIQDRSMALRMVPLQQTFQKMTRLVRDLAAKTKKQIHLELKGEETEIDKTIVEQIHDPLVHLLRNAVDHGVETPEERLAQGKPAAGIIHLDAYHKSGNVVIEIRDNGKGINVEKVRAKAIEKGLIKESDQLTEQELIKLIFLPGFSTKSKASEISGRGVGMDVVRTNIEKLGGKVEIQSTQGKGSVFYIMLPLTMAIIDGMSIRVGTEKYIIPTVSIRESIRPKKADVSTVSGKGEMLLVRGSLIPLVRLHSYFGLESTSGSIEESIVMVVEHEGDIRGLMVDELIGQHQVVIKSFDPRVKGVKGFSGAAIMSDGHIGLILDVASLYALIEKPKGRTAA